MTGWMRGIFGLVCGQNPAHTWAPGGALLPLCERCTGLYVGAGLALFLLILCRPRTDNSYRWLHALLVLAMTPFGFHLVPHGQILRTMSGHWFGFGIVGLLWLVPGKRLIQKSKYTSVFTYYLFMCFMSLASVPVIALRGGKLSALILSWLALAGLAAISGLLAANIFLLLQSMHTGIQRKTGAVTS